MTRNYAAQTRKCQYQTSVRLQSGSGRGEGPGVVPGVDSAPLQKACVKLAARRKSAQSGYEPACHRNLQYHLKKNRLPKRPGCCGLPVWWVL
ncbi:hypothetical protein GCM10011533_28230 [Streptosporangium jomthongense]|nr:hypothetical protein GCM10011533_28230 [Streptosporangium jomthongense]